MLPDKLFPSRFKQMKTDVCNVCEFLKVKINKLVGVEKEKTECKLRSHKEDASREYEREAGNLSISTFVIY